jgi:tight adherence protein B
VSSLYEATGNLIDVLAKTAECIEDPLSYELKKTVADYQKGASLKDALQNLTKRVPSKDLKIFVSGVLEAERFGTNPSDVISAVVNTINDRILLNEELKNEMKGQKTTIYVMLLLLPLMAGMSIMLFSQCKEILTQTIIGKLIICGIFFIEYFVWAFSAKGEVQREW